MLPRVSQEQPAPTSAAPWPAPEGAIARALAELGDAQLVGITGALLFALSAWPLLLVALPPLQDLPNHVATAHIVAHPQLYPEFQFNGLFKSNCLLTLWFYLLGGHGLFGAARAFTAATLAVNAVALPMFVLRFAGRRCLPVAALFCWPLVHSFSFSMGFLNFTFAFGLSLILLTVLDRQRERPTPLRGLGIAVLATAGWYAHTFPIAVVGLLVAVQVAGGPTWRARLQQGLTLLLPLAPAGLLSLVTAEHHLVKPDHSTAVPAAFMFLNPWELLDHLWLDVSGALTWRGSATILPALLLPYFVWRQGWTRRSFFSGRAVLLLSATYLALPSMLSNWNYLNCRLVPFLWLGLLIQLPSRLPRAVAGLLVVSALAFSATLGVDYLKLDRDRAAFTAGIPAVPQRATLLPLLFQHGESGGFTSSLTHTWGYYTVAKNTSAPLVFGVDRSHPINYRQFPPGQLIPPALDQFAQRFATAALTCKALKQDPTQAVCSVVWRDLWVNFWREAEPRFTHLLIWAMPAQARSLIPAAYHPVFAAGKLEIYARED
jgi:hypothetical protein